MLRNEAYICLKPRWVTCSSFFFLTISQLLQKDRSKRLGVGENGFVSFNQQ